MKVADKDIIILDELKLKESKTKIMVEILKAFETNKALVVTCGKDESVVRASSNIKGVKTSTADSVNVYDLINYDKLVITKEAVKKVEEVFA